MWPIVRAGVRPARSDEENPRGKHRQSRADRHSALPDPPCSAMASGSKDGGRSRSLDKLRTDAAVECRAVSRSLADQMGTKRPFRGLSEVCSGIVLSGTQFTEIEYAVEATTSATDGAVYCFRLTDAGNPTNFTSTEYGQVTLS